LQGYQPGRPPEQVKRDLGIERFINLASNENPFGAPESAHEAILKALPDLGRYPEFGALKLRKAIAQRLNVRVENLTIGSGSESIMANIVRAFLHGDDEVLTSEGTFLGFRVLVQAQGVKLNTVPLRNYCFDLNAIADAVNERTKLIYLCNPNNPTGTIFTRVQFEEFMAKIPEHVLVLLDEAYYEFAAQAPVFPDSLNYRIDNVLTLRTFSKSYGMAGVRLGYGLGHEYLVDFINRIKLPFEPNCLAQAAGLAALEDVEFMKRTIENNERGMNFITTELDRIGVRQIPSHGNFVMLEFGDQRLVDIIHQRLLEQGVAIRPLAAFGLPTCLRVTIGLPEENEIFMRIFERTVKQLGCV
jgi:histidinol-phosphate aminotransferase